MLVGDIVDLGVLPIVGRFVRRVALVATVLSVARIMNIKITKITQNVKIAAMTNKKILFYFEYSFTK